MGIPVVIGDVWLINTEIQDYVHV